MSVAMAMDDKHELCVVCDEITVSGMENVNFNLIVCDECQRDRIAEKTMKFNTYKGVK